MRTCAECTLCCTTHGVPILQKQSGIRCEFQLNPAAGCSIYSNRPRPCSNYSCAWRSGAIPYDDKPSITGNVIDNCSVSIYGIDSVTAVWLITSVGAPEAVRRYIDVFIKKHLNDIVRWKVVGSHQEETWWFPDHFNQVQRSEVASRLQ